MTRYAPPFLLAAILLLTSGVCSGQAGRPPQVDDAAWSTWLVRVEHLHERDAAPDDARELQALEDKLKEAETPRARTSAERALERARARMAGRSGFVIYGWAMKADRNGRSVTPASSEIGFIIPGGAAARDLFSRMNAGDCIAIDRNGARELFTFEGRKWIAAQRGVRIECDRQLKSQAFPVPPDDRSSHPSVRTTFRNTKSVPHNQKHQWHKATLRIQADADATSAAELTLWVAVRYVTPDGETLGPIIEQVKARRSQKTGAFELTRSFGMIALDGFTIDPSTTTVELLAAR